MNSNSQNSKRILVVCQHFWPEAFRINDICDYLCDHDYEIDVLCGIPNYPSGKFHQGYSYFKNKKQKKDGINIYRSLEIPRGDNSNKRILINYLSFPISSIFHIPRLLKNDYDKIFLYSLSPVYMSFAGIIIGKIKKTERIMYVLDLWPENLFSVLPIKNRILNKLVTKSSHWHYKNVEKIIALSEKMKDKLQDVSDLPDKKMIVLPQACEKVYEQEITDKALEERFKGTFNIVYAGNISPAQSFETILSAAEILIERGITDIKWIIVGQGMSYTWLKEQVSMRRLDDYFVFEGFKPIEEIPRYTTLADALIGCLVTSDLLEATIPAKVMSYLAAGRPLVLSMDGEVQVLINDTIKCGYASETENSTAMADNIEELKKLSHAQRQEMGLRARDYHFKNFERNLILDKLESFIQE